MSVNQEDLDAALAALTSSVTKLTEAEPNHSLNAAVDLSDALDGADSKAQLDALQKITALMSPTPPEGQDMHDLIAIVNTLESKARERLAKLTQSVTPKEPESVTLAQLMATVKALQAKISGQEKAVAAPAGTVALAPTL